MKSPVVFYVGWLLLLATVGFYGYGIIHAIVLSLQYGPIDKSKFPEYITTTMSTIQAMLLTNLGVLLGVSIAKPDSPIAEQMLFRKSSKLMEPEVAKDPMDLRLQIQLFGLVVYIISLVACMITWGINKFSLEPTEVMPLVSESGKMFMGVALAYATFILGTNAVPKT